MSFDPCSIHHVVLRTAEGASLTGDILRVAQHALDALPRRYPGLRVAGSFFAPDTLSLLLDFSRCDEDVSRAVQSFKTEVRKLAGKEGFKGVHFWRREYEEKAVESEQEMRNILSGWNL